MSSLDASALMQDPDGLRLLRDVLGPAIGLPGLDVAFGADAAAAASDIAEWPRAGAYPEQVLADLLN